MKKRIVGIGTAMAIILAIALVSPVSAAHYHMDVTTDHTRWTIDRSTLPVSFELSGTVTGNGTMIQDHDLALAGVRKNSLIYTHPGEVTTCEDLDVKSTLLDPVKITTTVIGKKVTVNIKEAWPTSLIDEIDLSYRGEGITSRETYGNNYDVVCSKFKATELKKVSKCNATLIRADITAVIKPGSVTEHLGFVRGTDYQLKATSDKFSHLGYKYVKDKKVLVSGSETYLGDYSLETRIKMVAFEPEKLEDESEGWLPCPWGEPLSGRIGAP